MRNAKITLAVGLALTAAAIAVVLSRSPLVVAGGNSVPPKLDAELVKGGVGSCQPAARIPSGTSAVRIAIEARAVGPGVSVKILSGSRVLSGGRQVAGWGAAPNVTVPIERFDRPVTGAHICVAIGPTVEPFRFRGTAAHPLKGGVGKLSDVTLRMEYLRADNKSWWSLASSIGYHMGLGRAAGGAWIAFLVLALMLAVTALTTLLAVRELR